MHKLGCGMVRMVTCAKRHGTVDKATGNMQRGPAGNMQQDPLGACQDTQHRLDAGQLPGRA